MAPTPTRRPGVERTNLGAGRPEPAGLAGSERPATVGLGRRAARGRRKARSGAQRGGPVFIPPPRRFVAGRAARCGPPAEPTWLCLWAGLPSAPRRCATRAGPPAPRAHLGAPARRGPDPGAAPRRRRPRTRCGPGEGKPRAPGGPEGGPRSPRPALWPSPRPAPVGRESGSRAGRGQGVPVPPRARGAGRALGSPGRTAVPAAPSALRVLSGKRRVASLFSFWCE